MTYRKIDTRMWRDSWFDSLSIDARYLFMFCITCDAGNMAGAFELPERQILLQTNLTKVRFDNASKEVSPKIIFFKDWVFIRNFTKYQADNENGRIGAKKIIDGLPDEIRQYFNNPVTVANGLKPFETVDIQKQKQVQSTEAEQSTPPYQEIIDTYNSLSGKQHRSDNDIFQKLVRGRFAEGYTSEDFKKVMNNKRAWLSDPKMVSYFRPSTLFAKGHFEEYLNETGKAKTIVTPPKETIEFLQDFVADAVTKILGRVPGGDANSFVVVINDDSPSNALNVKLTREQFLKIQTRLKGSANVG